MQNMINTFIIMFFMFGLFCLIILEFNKIEEENTAFQEKVIEYLDDHTATLDELLEKIEK